jgi:hypothetical protein
MLQPPVQRWRALPLSCVSFFLPYLSVHVSFLSNLPPYLTLFPPVLSCPSFIPSLSPSSGVIRRPK